MTREEWLKYDPVERLSHLSEGLYRILDEQAVVVDIEKGIMFSVWDMIGDLVVEIKRLRAQP